MGEPDYKRPFDERDFRGYFRWTQALTLRLRGNLYHACHEPELKKILAADELGLRSEWKLELPQYGLWSVPGVWTGLNYYRQGNQFGPCLITFPISVLNGKHFMVFRRKGAARKRYFFVQYESRIPIYCYKKKRWRKLNPDAYFSGRGTRLSRQPGAIYDIVVTQPLPLDDVTIVGVEHPKCIPQKCNGCSGKKSKQMIRKLALADWRSQMVESPEYREVMSRFPALDGVSVELFDPDDE